MKKGPLIKVEISPGRYVKMYQADAEARGLVQKARPPQQDKIRPPQQDKQQQPPAEPEEETAVSDDLTQIPGVGPATARALAARGIDTFAALRAAGELDWLTPQANQAIAAWREAGE